MPDDATARLEDLRTTLTGAMLAADQEDPLVALHVAAALGVLNQRLLPTPTPEDMLDVA